MPTGVYRRDTPSFKEAMKKKSERLKGIAPFKMTDAVREKISKTLKGNIPHNKGVMNEETIKKNQLFDLGLPIECRHHGFHTEWRIFNRNVRCRKCDNEREKKSRVSNPIKALLRDAKSRKIDFNLTEEFIKNLLDKQNNKCALSGITFSDILKPSIDRIDSNKGYLMDNVQLVIFEINRMKTNLSQQRFIELCRLVHLGNINNN